MARIDECAHFLAQDKCDGWIISRFKGGEVLGGQDELESSETEIIEEICSKCPFFKPKPSPGFATDP